LCISLRGAAVGHTSVVERDLVRLSKRLAFVLRHDPGSAGLVLDPNGWVDVDVLLAALGMTRPALDAVVESNDKRRYAIRPGPDGKDQIRASQGHSVTVDLALTPVPPPDVLFHGTSAGAVASIRSRGLLAGRRHHVHLSADRPTALRVGRRRSGPVALLAVDAAAMAGAGHAFYVSDNGVWLTAHVPPEFLSLLDPDSHL
jgi:putative RNA 2'-phosphotransferase